MQSLVILMNFWTSRAAVLRLWSFRLGLTPLLSNYIYMHLFITKIRKLMAELK